jgi:hypothetical protein
MFVSTFLECSLNFLSFSYMICLSDAVSSTTGCMLCVCVAVGHAFYATYIIASSHVASCLMIIMHELQIVLL